MPRQPTSADIKFRAFSDRTRLRILHLLIDGELCVCDIVRIIRVPQPTASRHLSYLRRARLVTPKRKGQWMYYSIAPAKSAFEKKLLECLADCFAEVPSIRADKTRLKRLRKNGVRC